MTTKHCNKCDTTKPIEEFGADKQRYDGLQYQCKACRIKHRKSRAETIKLQKKASYQKCKATALEKKKEYYQANKQSILAQRKQYHEANRPLVLQRQKSFHAQNPDWYKQYRLKSQGKVQAKEAKRRAAKLLRTPKWLTEDDVWMIEQAHELAAMRTQLFGFPWHVDHVIPLQGKKVSGLHVPLNIQVIPGALNTSKQNTFEV